MIELVASAPSLPAFDALGQTDGVIRSTMKAREWKMGSACVPEWLGFYCARFRIIRKGVRVLGL
jgi:hypothetical protein